MTTAASTTTVSTRSAPRSPPARSGSATTGHRTVVHPSPAHWCPATRTTPRRTPPARRSAPPPQATRCSLGTPTDDCLPGPSRPATRPAPRRRSATSGSPASSKPSRPAAPTLPGKSQAKPATEPDRSNSACRNNVYFANSRFVGNGGSKIYFYRSTDHGATVSHGTLLTKSANAVQDPEIAVTANGHVYVTYDATLHQGNSTYDAILYNKS